MATSPERLPGERVLTTETIERCRELTVAVLTEDLPFEQLAKVIPLKKLRRILDKALPGISLSQLITDERG